MSLSFRNREEEEGGGRKGGRRCVFKKGVFCLEYLRQSTAHSFRSCEQNFAENHPAGLQQRSGLYSSTKPFSVFEVQLRNMWSYLSAALSTAVSQ